MKDLAVFLSGRRVGTITQAAGLRFRYDEEYRAADDPTPLSLSMPLSEAEHGNRVTLAWVNGLLPADREVRARIAERGGVRAANPAALLTVIGLDCPGAVQVVPVDRVEEIHRPVALAPVDDEWIGARIALLRRDEAAWQIADERWSIGGGQSKFTLARGFAGEWYDPQGAAASTHIVKPGVPTARLQALNEHASLTVLRALGIPAARSEYLEFAGQSALVVERFDRVRREGDVLRVHAEDLCQSLGNQTTYERYGGPTAREVVDLLRRHAPGAPERFAEALAVGYLLGVTRRARAQLLGPPGRGSRGPGPALRRGLLAALRDRGGGRHAPAEGRPGDRGRAHVRPGRGRPMAAVPHRQLPRRRVGPGPCPGACRAAAGRAGVHLRRPGPPARRR